MAKLHTCFCSMCGIDFKSPSPFAQSCPRCKVNRFKKPQAGEKLVELVACQNDIKKMLSPAKLVDMALVKK